MLDTSVLCCWSKPLFLFVTSVIFLIQSSNPYWHGLLIFSEYCFFQYLKAGMLYFVVTVLFIYVSCFKSKIKLMLLDSKGRFGGWILINMDLIFQFRKWLCLILPCCVVDQNLYFCGVTSVIFFIQSSNPYWHGLLIFSEYYFFQYLKAGMLYFVVIVLFIYVSCFKSKIKLMLLDSKGRFSG